jgi:cellobiose-specific phosphotransferase system component IIA
MNKTIVALVIALLVVTQVFASTIVVSQPGTTDQEKLSRHISFLYNQTVRLENFINSHVANETKKQELLGEISSVKNILDQAKNTLAAGDLNQTRELIRQASSGLRAIALQLTEEIRERAQERKQRFIEAEIRALTNQVVALSRVAEKFKSLRADVSNVTSLLTSASNLLSQAQTSLKNNDTAKALQLLTQAREQIKQAEKSIRDLATQLRARQVQKDLEFFINATQRIYERLQKFAPNIAQMFKNWSDTRVKEVQSLISQGKNVEALLKLRQSFFEMNHVVAGLMELGRVDTTLREAENIAKVIRTCNATLASQIDSNVQEIRVALNNKDLQKVHELMGELRQLIAQSRFACRPARKK